MPVEEYERLISDEALFDAAMAEDDGTRYPGTVAARLAAGVNPVLVAREWRGMAREELAKKAGLTSEYIAMLENGKRTLTMEAASELAEALEVDEDFLNG